MDAAGVLVSRNPVLHERAQGLVRIDQNWVSQFIAE